MKKFFSLFAGLLMAATMSANIYHVDVKQIYGDVADGTKVTTLYDATTFTVSVNAEGQNGSIYGKDNTVRDWRVYQSNHACVTVKAGTGWKLHSVNVIFTNANNGTLLYGGRAVENAETVPAGDPNVMHFRVGGPNGNGQIRISHITVTYAEKAKYGLYGELSDEGKTFTISFGENFAGEGKYTYDAWIDNAFASSRKLVEKVVFNENVAKAVPETGFNFFYTFDKLNTIEGLQYLNTSEMTNMIAMFGGCGKLTQLDLRSFKTEHVEDMSSMFYNCKNLESLNLSSFQTPALTSTAGMFIGCEKLQKLDLSSFNTENVTNMSTMFWNCAALQNLGLSNFNTAKVTDMERMFASCEKLEYVDLSSFNTKKVTDMSRMFLGCEKLQKLDLLSFKFDKVTSTAGMFQNCIELERIYCKANVRGNATVTSSGNMFAGCSKLKGEQGTTYNSSYLDKSWARPDGGSGSEGYFSTEAPAVYGVFNSDENGPFLYIKYYPKSSGDLTPDEWNSDSRIFSITRIKVAVSFKNARPTSTAHWFEGAESLTSEGLSDFLANLNTALTTDMESMFAGCKSVETVDLRKWDLSAVKNTAHMFDGCNSLETIYCTYDLAQNAGLNSTEMFGGCVALVGDNGTVWEDGKSDAAYAHVDEGGNPGYFCYAPKQLYGVFSEDGNTFTIYYDGQKELRGGVTKWWSNTYYEQRKAVLSIQFDKSVKAAKPTSTSQWFYGFLNVDIIKSFDFLNTSEVTDMSYMFDQCKHIVNLDLTSFNTAKATNMKRMFSECSELRLIDFGENFKTDNVTDMSYMFAFCHALKRLDLSKFNTAKVENMNSMFKDCDELYTLDLNSFDVSNVQDMEAMFYDCEGLVAIYCDKDWESEATQLTNSSEMFLSCFELVGENKAFDYELDNDITLAKVKDASDNDGYFRKTTGELIYGVLDSYTNTLTIRFDKDKLTNDGLTPNEWYEAEYGVTTIAQMVNKVVFDESVAKARPISTKEWFYDFSNLTEFEHLDSLKTEKVWDMDLMFAMCSSLKQLDLSPWDISHVYQFQGVFAGCTDLETLDLPNDWYDDIDDVSYMFLNCSSLKTIYCNVDIKANLSSSAETDNMFYGCTSLVGGAGTMCNGDPACAKPDGGTEDPGYFTSKYLVEFIYWNPEGDEWDSKEMYVRQGEYAIPPVVPEYPGYAMKGWTTTDMAEGEFVTSTDILITPVTEDITYSALYVGQKYQLTFKYLDEDGETWLDKNIVATYQEQVNLGDFTLESLPKVVGKHFVSWQYTIDEVTEKASFDQLNGMTWILMENLTFTAQYETNVYTVTYVDPDGWNTLGSEEVEHGNKPKVEINPDKDGYTFLGWKLQGGDDELLSTDDVKALSITADSYFLAQYKANPGTGIEQIEQPILVGQKLIINGQLFILVGDKMYDTTGKLVK